jgi:hypothetical protein
MRRAMTLSSRARARAGVSGRVSDNCLEDQASTAHEKNPDMQTVESGDFPA